jgi:hypothetical protein
LVHEGVVLRKLKVLRVARMAAIFFLKHGFLSSMIIKLMSERINLMKLKCMDHRFGLGYMLKRDDYKRVVNRKRKAIIVKIKGHELGEKGFVILPLQTTFPGFVEVIRFGMTYLHIGAFGMSRYGTD